MPPLRYHRHRFPPEIIQHAIWLYLRFTLSYRDVEELLAERGSTSPMGTVKLAESKLGRSRVARVNGRDDDDGSRPDLRWLSLPAEIISYAVWLYFRFL